MRAVSAEMFSAMSSLYRTVRRHRLCVHDREASVREVRDELVAFELAYKEEFGDDEIPQDVRDDASRMAAEGGGMNA